MTQREMMTVEQAVAFLETNAFAQDVLAKAIAKVGAGNLGGQLEELRLRLSGYADSINASEPMQHQRAALAANKLLARFGVVADKGTGHTTYSHYRLTLSVATAVDAIEMFEKFGHHLESTYLKKTGGTSFVPESQWNNEKHGEPVDTVAYWAELGYGSEKKICGYINSRDDADTCVRIDIILTAEPLLTRQHHPAPRDGRGRKIGDESWSGRDGTGYFPRSIRLWSSPGTPNNFYLC